MPHTGFSPAYTGTGVQVLACLAFVFVLAQDVYQPGIRQCKGVHR